VAWLACEVGLCEVVGDRASRHDVVGRSLSFHFFSFAARPLAYLNRKAEDLAGMTGCRTRGLHPAREKWWRQMRTDGESVMANKRAAINAIGSSAISVAFRAANKRGAIPNHCRMHFGRANKGNFLLPWAIYGLASAFVYLWRVKFRIGILRPKPLFRGRNAGSMWGNLRARQAALLLHLLIYVVHSPALRLSKLAKFSLLASTCSGRASHKRQR